MVLFQLTPQLEQGDGSIPVMLKKTQDCIIQIHKPCIMELMKWCTWGRNKINNRVARRYPAIKLENNSFLERGWVFSATAVRNFFISGFLTDNG